MTENKTLSKILSIVREMSHSDPSDRISPQEALCQFQELAHSISDSVVQKENLLPTVAQNKSTKVGFLEVNRNNRAIRIPLGNLMANWNHFFLFFTFDIITMSVCV